MLSVLHKLASESDCYTGMLRYTYGPIRMTVKVMLSVLHRLTNAQWLIYWYVMIYILTNKNDC